MSDNYIRVWLLIDYSILTVTVRGLNVSNPNVIIDLKFLVKNRGGGPVLESLEVPGTALRNQGQESALIEQGQVEQLFHSADNGSKLANVD